MEDKNTEHKTISLGIKPLFAIFVLIMIISVAVCLVILVGMITPKEQQTKAIILASSLIAALVLITILLYKLIIMPIYKIENVINDVLTELPGSTSADKSHFTSLSTVFLDLQSIINRMKVLILRESNAQLMKKQAELDALQSQINPHFLYNTLDTIRGQARLAGQSNIEAMSLALSKLFRYSISNYNDFVTFEEELKAIDNYFLIQNFRFDNKFTKISQIDPDTLKLQVPKMLIQPLVENAIRHPKVGHGTIIINAYKTPSRLVINIDDDGVGIDQTRLVAINDMLNSDSNTLVKKKSGTSIGIYNTNSRIRLLFGPEYRLSVFSTKDVGTNIQISLPLL